MSPRYTCPECGQSHGGYRASAGAVSTICRRCYEVRIASLKLTHPAPAPKSRKKTQPLTKES